MRRVRILAVVFAAVAAVLPRVADAAAPAPALTGTVTVSGRGSGYVAVTLPRAVDFRADKARELTRPTVRFTGGAYGWLLTTAAGPNGRGYAGVTKLPAALGGSTVFRMDGKDPRTGQHLFETSTLRPGSYRLYLLTNGPGGVTFRLPGLAGASSVVTRSGVAATATTLGVPMTAGVGPSAHANGVTFGGRTPTLALSFHYVRTTAQAAAQYGWCTYSDGPPGGQWLPGCPGADVALIGAYGVAQGCCGLGTGGGFFVPGTWGYGRFYDTVGVVEQAADFFVVVPLA